MCRRCIKSLIKQVKQFTTGTIKFVRITVKPVQQPLRKLKIYNIESRMEEVCDPTIKSQKGKAVCKRLKPVS